MNSYLTLPSGYAEIVVQRSRFIAYIRGINGESDAREILAELKKKHYDATHVCYAYIADEQGHVSKSSDDGEPSGTAGAPILAVISKYRKVLAAVVRYFGGTKLGVGGLVKAYSDAAAAGVASAAAQEYILSNVYELTVSYPEFERCRKCFSDALVLSIQYADDVKCKIAAPVEYDILSKITETLGRVPDVLLSEEGSYIKY